MPSATPKKIIWPNNTTPVQVKAGRGSIAGVRSFNLNAAPRYLKFYDSALAPTVGTTAPLDVVGIPGNTSGGGNNSAVAIGEQFVNGLWVAVTTGILDSDTTAPSASEVMITVLFE